jgi:hypothetical protein
MTATLQPETKSPSRRALLAGALGGLGALAASAIGRTSPVRAANGDPVTVGGTFSATTDTIINNATTGSGVFEASSSGSGTALTGRSYSGAGVIALSDLGTGVEGDSGSGVGVSGVSQASDQPAIIGQSSGNSTGVLGYSSGGLLPPAPKAKTGVFGYAAQDAASVGVRGESPAGFGVYGKTTGTGFAGYFNGKVYMSQFVEIGEIATPASPAAHKARLFIKDNGGKTQLCVRFPTGAVKILATES